MGVTPTHLTARRPSTRTAYRFSTRVQRRRCAKTISKSVCDFNLGSNAADRRAARDTGGQTLRGGETPKFTLFLQYCAWKSRRQAPAAERAEGPAESAARDAVGSQDSVVSTCARVGCPMLRASTVPVVPSSLVDRFRCWFCLASLQPSQVLADLRHFVPELQSFGNLDVVVPFNRDSCRVGPKEWVKLAKLLHASRSEYHAFLVRRAPSAAQAAVQFSWKY